MSPLITAGRVDGHRVTPMFLIASASRRTFRERQMADRLSRLAAVKTEPARAQLGRVVTVVLRTPPQGKPDTFDLLNYIHPWWTTVNKVGLRGTVLYSGLSDEQVAAATTRCVDFVRVQPGVRHVFHERHFLIRDFLRTIDDANVFLTDASDVAFKRDPFAIVAEDDGRHTLFVGREKHRIAGSKCVRNEMKRQFGRVYFPFRPVLNPGIIGGSREMVIRALDQITAMINCLDARLVASDMCIVNRALYESFAPGEIFTGLPLHSTFKGWEFETTAAILHK